MTPIRRFISCNAYDVNGRIVREVISVSIHLDGKLLRDMAIAARQRTRQQTQEQIYQVPRLKLTQKDTDKLLAVITEYLMENERLLRAVNMPSVIDLTGKKNGGNTTNDVKDYQDDDYANHSNDRRLEFDRNGWKGVIFIPQLLNPGKEIRAVKYSDEQILERAVEVDYETEPQATDHNQVADDEDEKPLKPNKTLNITYSPLLKLKDGFSHSFNIAVFVQQRPSK